MGQTLYNLLFYIAPAPPQKNLYKIEVKCLDFVIRKGQPHIPDLQLTIYVNLSR